MLTFICLIVVKDSLIDKFQLRIMDKSAINFMNIDIFNNIHSYFKEILCKSSCFRSISEHCSYVNDCIIKLKKENYKTISVFSKELCLCLFSLQTCLYFTASRITLVTFLT